MASILRRIRSLEQVRAIKRSWRKSWPLLARLYKRKPAFVFASPRRIFAKAAAVAVRPAAFESLFEEVAAGKMPGLFAYRQVLYHPWQLGRSTEHAGGLIDPAGKALVKPAIHYKSGTDQELPDTDLDALLQMVLPNIKAPVLYAGVLYKHFGHFLLESLGRLWAYAALRHGDPYLLFHVHGYAPEYFDNDSVMHQVLRGFGIPVDKVLFISTPVLLEAVIVPEQKYGYGLNRTVDEAFLRFVRSFKYPVNVPGPLQGANKIYVSRSKMPAHSGRMIGEKLFEQYLIQHGYHIVYPERLLFFQQLSVYQQAKQIIFSDGGALHGCVLLPDLKARVAVIARRRDPRWESTEIIDQFVGYKIETCWIDTITAQYQFGLESWDAISEVDWQAASHRLLEAGFVDQPLAPFEEAVYTAARDAEMSAHIRANSDRPGFIAFMRSLRERNSAFPDPPQDP